MPGRRRSGSKAPRAGSRSTRPRRRTTKAAGRPEPQLPREEDLIGIGVIRKPHGIRGEANVEPLTDEVNRLGELHDVILVSPDRRILRPARIESARFHGARALLRFAGIDTPEAVRDFQNWSIEIREDQRRPLGQGEYFLHDLIGLRVISREGELIGETTDAQESGSGVLLTVRTSNGRSFEIPFVESICIDIDIAQKKIVAELPAGLADLENVAAIEDEPSAETASFRVDVLTIFPRMFDPFLEQGVIARARKNRLLRIKIWDLRDFTEDRHRSTDDVGYGGGAGMVMLAEPIFRCIDAIRREESGDPWVVLMSPQGDRFDHRAAVDISKKHWLVILCGRYEGVDERVREGLVQQELSVGDFVVSGGEVPAMLVIEAVSRLVEGVVGDWNSVSSDSFYNGLLDHPHYTRPAELRGMKVPEVLLSGHAAKIRQWRKEQSIRATLQKRPDLLEKAELDDEARGILEKIRNEPSR